MIIIKQIPNFSDYFINENGEIFSQKTGKLIRLKPYLDTKNRYLMIRLIGNDGKRKSLLVHRLVAEIFIPNPNNYSEVDHIDNNPQNPKKDNLQWCTRKYNLAKSYETLSPARNCNPCILYKNNKNIGEFSSITEAIQFAVTNYNVSKSGLERNLKSKDVVIYTKKNDRKNKAF